MSKTTLIIEKLEALLQGNWTQFIDSSLLMKSVLIDARDADLKIIEKEDIPPQHTKISVTDLKIGDNSFDIWVEFTVPNEESVTIGTHVYALNFSGEILLKETYGVHFVSKNQTTSKIRNSCPSSSVTSPS